MKKGLFLMAGLICSFLMFNDAAFAGYLVSGAGVQEVDGLYCETGEKLTDGRPVYRKDGTTWEIFYQPVAPGANWWWIDDQRQIMQDAVYYIESSAATPPLMGWQCHPDNLPPPTLSFQSCDSKSGAKAVPAFTEWGIFALSILLLCSAAWFIRRRKRI